MPKKKRYRSRYQGGSDDMAVGGPNSRSRGKRSRQGSGGGNRRGFSGPRLGPDGQPIVGDQPADGAPLAEGEEEVVKEFTGLLEMHPNGYGFLRSSSNNYARERTDPFVPGTMIEKYGLRQGVMIRSNMVHARRQQGPRVKEILDIDGRTPEEYMEIKNFDTLTAINPEKWLKLEVGQTPLTNRVIDLLTPLGRGQRALIVAPPRTGKTVMLQHISAGISKNYPEVVLIVLLIDERPEEVTDMRRNVVNGEVIASSLDEDVDSHVRLSQLVIDRCKRLTEMGKDVFLLMDSITRLARAFNKWVGNSGPTMSGGVNIKAMDIPKKLFATARAFAEGGSLTIVGTALIDTGSRMDELIFQEFKGTGNMELVLDRKLSDRRVWPAIDISQSGTRREELLHDPETLHAVTMIRRTLNSMHPVEAMEQLTTQLGKFKSNHEFLRLITNAKILD
jgi:transcription termination factor Rho